MKITKVEVHHVKQSLWGSFWEVQRSAPSCTPLSHYEKFAASMDTWQWPQGMLLVRIETDTGLSGLGWAEDGVEAASSIVRLHLSRFLMGADADDIEVLWDQMFRASIPYGRKGAAIEAISAVDIALWDLRGKACGMPVHKLIGGQFKPSIKAYASHLQPVPMDRFVEEAEAYVKEGYTAMKMRMPGGPRHGARGIEMNLERVRVVREAVGPMIDLMVDAYMGWDLPFAKLMAHALGPYRVSWIEEPLLPDLVDDYADLRKHSPVPIATGEHEFTRFGFARLISAGAADILQPDVHRAGGISEMLKICDLAAAAGLAVIPHILSAPTLHVVATRQNCPMVENLEIPIWARGRPATLPAVLGCPAVQGGMVRVPEEPGLGVRINTDLLPQLRDWNR